MLAKRLIPCLDVKDGVVVKGVQFRGHEVMGEVCDLAARYRDEGADELVFYDITASADGRRVTRDWVQRVAKLIDIPFCVAGGIRTLEDAREILASGADKISINSPALETPDLIDQMARAFGQQCVVIGIDSRLEDDGDWWVYQYTGNQEKTQNTRRRTRDWVQEVVQRGAGEIVLNCMNKDGVRDGYDIDQLCAVRAIASVPLIASGGAGTIQHFIDVFDQAHVDGALAASVFHKKIVAMADLKKELAAAGIVVRS